MVKYMYCVNLKINKWEYIFIKNLCIKIKIVFFLNDVYIVLVSVFKFKIMKRFKIGDRVKDFGFFGEGEVIKIIKSDLDSKVIVGYMVMFDIIFDVRYNMGENFCFMLNG